MNTVEPIRDIDTVWDIADYLGETSERNRMMFLFGIYVGIRISYILKLKVRDVRDKTHIYIREKKTKKEKRFPINEELRPELNRSIRGKADYERLFQSRQGSDHVQRVRAYQILNEAGQKFGVDHVGTHTLRKTFGYHFYQQTHDIVTLQKIFNHSSIEVTFRYIGISQDMQDAAIKKISFKRR